MSNPPDTFIDSSRSLPPKCFTIEPNKELNFQYTNNKYGSELTITNILSKEALIYKIRVTDSDQYFVHPASGIIMPRKKKKVYIDFASKTPINERSQDKFLVQVQIFNGKLSHNEQENLAAIAKQLSDPTIESQKTRLKIHFEVEDNPQTHTPKSGKSVNLSPKNRSSNQSPQNQLEFLKGLSPMNQQSGQQQTVSPKMSTFTLKGILKSNFEAANRKELQKIIAPSSFRQELVEKFQSSVSSYSPKDNEKRFVFSSQSSPKIAAQSSPAHSETRSSVTSSYQSPVYKKKFEVLKKRFEQQQERLSMLQIEKNESINEMNKIKLAWTPVAELENNGLTQVSGHSAKKYELWQIMIVSIICLIVGSFCHGLKPVRST